MRGLVPDLRSAHPLGPQLPSLYQDDDLALRFVAAFDDALAPVLSTLDNLAAHVDPGTCPEDWVGWLGEWLGLDVAGAPPGRRRTLLTGAPAVHAARGTSAGIAEAVRAALDVEVEVEDSGATTWSPVPGGPLPGDADPVVRVTVRGDVGADRVAAVVDDVVPAHVRVDIQVRGGQS